VAKPPPKPPEKPDDDNLELIKTILDDPNAEKQIKLPKTPFPTVPVTPEPGSDD
jgi:hypothetical protein